MTWQSQYLARFYNPAGGFVDGTREFHQLCASFCPPGARILEVGAGPSNPTSRFLATLGDLHGIDPDPCVRDNDALKTAEVLTQERYPYPDAHFDACVSNYVCEHVGDPAAHLRQIRRVLRPGGCYIFRTPNRFHYVAIVSSLTPHWFHELVANRLRNMPAAAHDPYPAHYHLNSRGQVTRHAGQAGFSIREMRLVEKEPSYAMSSRTLFLAFMAYERLVNSTDLLAMLRANLFVVLQRQA
jgi:SAM-dependent methyltransferase